MDRQGRLFFCPFQRTAIRHAFRGVIKESAEQHDASGLSGVRSGARRGPAGGGDGIRDVFYRGILIPSLRGTYFHITKPSACRA